MMNDATTPTRQPAAVSPPGKLAYATPTTAPLVAGRRSFFKYRDLGVTAASSRRLRAQVTSEADGMTQPTGAFPRLGGRVRLHAQWMGRPGVRGRPETAHPVGRVALHPGRPAAQRDGGIKRPGAPGDLRSRGHGHCGLRAAGGLVQARSDPAKRRLLDGAPLAPSARPGLAAASGTASQLDLLIALAGFLRQFLWCQASHGPRRPRAHGRQAVRLVLRVVLVRDTGNLHVDRAQVVPQW